MYAFLIYKTVILFSQYQSLISNTNLIYHHPINSGFITDLAFILNHKNAELLTSLFLIFILTTSLIGLLNKSTMISNVILWFCILSINNYLYPTLTAGDYLLNQLLFFNIFLYHHTSKNIMVNDFKTAIHNSALLSIKIQICLVYVCSFLFKVTDVQWLNGSALASIFQIPEYTNYFLMSLNPIVCMILTYLTLAYQFLFPLGICFTKLKPYLLIFGVLQHLVIAFFMGLFSFGITMIICYILFLKYDGKGIIDNTL